MHAAPMYIAETAPSQIRGQLISLKEFFIVLGMVVSSRKFLDDSDFDLWLMAESKLFSFITRLVSCTTIVKCLNFVQAGYGIGSLLVDTVGGWRYIYGASTPLAVIMGIGMWWLPSSPRWLLLRAIQGKGNMQELKDNAIYCLRRLRGPVIGDSAPEQVNEVLTELAYVGEEKPVLFSEIFRGKCSKALIIGAGVVLLQQVSY